MKKLVSNLESIQILINKLTNSSPTEENYPLYANELLIKIYTSYETYLKRIFSGMYTQIAENYRILPLIAGHNIHKEQTANAFFVPKSKKEELAKSFPLLKEWYFWDKLNQLDTLIYERNNYAHTGMHQATVEQMLISIIDMQQVMRFLNIYYGENAINIENEEIKVFITKERMFIEKCVQCSAIATEMLNGLKKFQQILPDCFKELKVLHKDIVKHKVFKNKKCKELIILVKILSEKELVFKEIKRSGNIKQVKDDIDEILQKYNLYCRGSQKFNEKNHEEAIKNVVSTLKTLHIQ